jgi:hypothetical protein
MGKCVHKALEYAYAEKNNGSTPPLDSIEEIFNKAWNEYDLKSVKVVKSNKTVTDYHSTGITLIDSFFSNVLRFDNNKTIELEKNFEIHLDSNIAYCGVIDRISRSPDNILRITDYKTGKRVGDPATDNQLRSYALWAFDAFQDNKIEICFEDLRNLKTKTALISRDKASIIRKKLLKNIKHVIKAKKYKSNPSVLCGWCGYNPICDDAQPFKTRNYSGDNTWNNRKKYTGKKCPYCGSKLEKRYGRYGSFIGCTDYPDCRYTRDEW